MFVGKLFHLGFITEVKGSGGTGFGAGRLQPGRNTLVAHMAFDQLLLLIAPGGDAPGAGLFNGLRCFFQIFGGGVTVIKLNFSGHQNIGKWRKSKDEIFISNSY